MLLRQVFPVQTTSTFFDKGGPPWLIFPWHVVCPRSKDHI
jgi:hypothetical protein